MAERTEKRTPRSSEVVRRTISQPGGKLAGLYVYLGEPSKVVLDRVAGNVGKIVKDFTGKINVSDFIHNAGTNICECDCFCSCSCDCTCNCDCVCYCDCNCPCLCQSSCNDALALQDIRNLTTQMNVLRERLNVRFGQIAEIIESLQRE